MTKSVEMAFARIVHERLTEATSRTGHPFSDLYEMFGKIGETETARVLTSPGTVGSFTYGFRILALADLLHLSIEQAVIDFADSGLFGEEHVSNGRARLAMARVIKLDRRTTTPAEPQPTESGDDRG